MAYINWPSAKDLLANPEKYGSFFTRTGADGYSIYSRLAESNRMYGMGEVERNYGITKEQWNRDFDRIANDAYNAVNSGASLNSNSSQMQDLKKKVAAMNSALALLSPSILGDQLKTVEQMTGGLIKDPQGTQVVSAGGKVETPSTFGDRTLTTPSPAITEPQVSIQDASGNVQWVPQSQVGSYTAQGWKTEGSNLSGGVGTPAPVAPTTTPSGTDTTNTSGIDQSGWTDTMKQSYDAMKKYTDDLTAQGKVINPSITIDQATIDKFTAQAKTEMAPYYGQIFKQADADLAQASGKLKESYAGNIRDIGASYGKNLETTQENFARRGLDFSSERDKAEKMLADETKQRLEEAASNAQNQAYTLGSGAEAQYGSERARSLDLGVASGYQPITGQAGTYGLTGATGTRSLFNPLGGITGTTQRQQTVDEQTRLNELQKNERELRNFNIM